VEAHIVRVMGQLRDLLTLESKPDEQRFSALFSG
jgi:hypothetical protein